jgi:hypothetical protein
MSSVDDEQNQNQTVTRRIQDVTDDGYPDLSNDLSTSDLYIENSSELTIINKFPPRVIDLNISHCPSLTTVVEFPNGLEVFNIWDCADLEELPSFPESLVVLDITDCPSLTHCYPLPYSLTSFVTDFSILKRFISDPNFSRSLLRLIFKGGFNSNIPLNLIEQLAQHIIDTCSTMKVKLNSCVSSQNRNTNFSMITDDALLNILGFLNTFSDIENKQITDDMAKLGEVLRDKRRLLYGMYNNPRLQIGTGGKRVKHRNRLDKRSNKKNKNKRMNATKKIKGRK